MTRQEMPCCHRAALGRASRRFHGPGSQRRLGGGQNRGRKAARDCAPTVTPPRGDLTRAGVGWRGCSELDQQGRTAGGEGSTPRLS